MNFLKTLFWVVLAVVAVIFAMNNWITVTIALWGGLQAEVKLPILLLFAFLVGSLPTVLWHHTIRWRLKRRLDSTERALADVRGLSSVDPSITPAAPPPSAGARWS